MTLIEQRCVLK